MATTLEQITNEFYSIVGQTPDDGTGKNVLYDITSTQQLANDVQDSILKKWKFPFMRTKTLFKTGVDTTNSATIATTDTSISMTATTGFATAGAAWIEHDVVNYTGTSSTSLTGVTNIDIAHDSAVDVEYLKAFPTDYNHNGELWVGRSSNSNLRLYKNVLEEDFDISAEPLRWTIVIDKDGTEYIRINNSSSSEIAVFNYYKKPTTMTSSVNSAIPDDFAVKVIARTMAGTDQILKNDNEQDTGTIILQIANKEVADMKRYYSMREGIVSTGWKTKYNSLSSIRNTGHRCRNNYYN